MVKRILLKTLILLALILTLITFNWQTKTFELERALKIAGIDPVHNVEDLRNYSTKNGQKIVEVNGLLIAPFEEYQLGEDYYTLIDRAPKHLEQAFIAIEDKRFKLHQGIDYLGLIRAFMINLKNQEYREGGSTITQQLVKNMFLTPDKKLLRKVEELLIARQLEQEFNKDQILEMYLNQIYFGPRIYGIGRASEIFFGKKVTELNLAEAAMLAGIPKNPKAYSPTNNFAQAKERQGIVLGKMEELEFITEKEKEQAINVNISIVK